MNKRIWINFMASKNREADSSLIKELLEPLPLKELKIIKKYPELVARVGEICRYSKTQMAAHLREAYDIDTTSCQNGDVWVQADEVDDLQPDWSTREKGGTGVRLPYNGWYLTHAGEENEFMPWARALLFQEVRENGWMNYMEHKLKIAAGKKNTNPFEEDVAAAMGVPWYGSGGNYA